MIKDGDCDGVGEFNFVKLYLPNQAIKSIFLFTNVAWKVRELDGVSLWFFDDYYGSFSCKSAEDSYINVSGEEIIYDNKVRYMEMKKKMGRFDMVIYINRR